MLSYFLKSEKNTESKNSKAVKTKNGRIILLSNSWQPLLVSGRRRMWPVNWVHLFVSIFLRFLDSAPSTSLFLNLSIQRIFNILQRQFRWNTYERFVILGLSFHVSHAFKVLERTIEFYSRSSTVTIINLDLQTVWGCLKTEQAFTILLSTFYWMLPKEVKFSTASSEPLSRKILASFSRFTIFWILDLDFLSTLVLGPTFLLKFLEEYVINWIC